MTELGTDPRHHPAPEDLLEYASGTGAEWLSLMVACHLTFCPRCRDEVALLDELGGALLEQGGDPAEGASDPGDVLADAEWVERASAHATTSLDANATAARPAQPAPRAGVTLPPELQGKVPRALHPYLAQPRVRWHFLAPGIKHVPLDSPQEQGEDVQLRLIQFSKGFVIPPHGHAGLEWLLILDGDIGDSHTGERYGRGDVCCSDVGKEHSQDVSPSEPCIALVANLGPLVPKTLLGRVLAKIVKI